MIGRASDFHGAEPGQMRGQKLRVQQHKPPEPQPRHQMRQRQLRCVALARDHALAEKCPADRQPIKPANQRAVPPYFDAVSMAALVEFDEKSLDSGIDPGFRPSWRRCRAGGDQRRKISVGDDLAGRRPQRAGQSPRQMECLEWQHPAPVRIEKMQRRRIPPLRHWKQAEPVGAQQQVGGQLGVVRGHDR